MAQPSEVPTTRGPDQPQEGTEQAGPSGRNSEIWYRQYESEHDLEIVMRLIDAELSEPYTIFTYRYFLHNWPELCWIAYDGDKPFGTVVCKLEIHRDKLLRGYVAMLVVDKTYRGKGVGRELVKRSIEQMIQDGAEEVALEAEEGNKGALKLYESLGFIRDKRLHRYYLNGSDAYRLKLLLPLGVTRMAQMHAEWMSQYG